MHLLLLLKLHQDLQGVCVRLQSSFAEFIFMTRAAGAVQPQRARQLLALNLENQQPAEGDPRPRLCSVLVRQPPLSCCPECVHLCISACAIVVVSRIK